MKQPDRTAQRLPEAGRPEVYLHRIRVAAARAQGGDIIDLGFADVRRGPPAKVVADFEDRLRKEPEINHYGEVPGLPELRESIAADLNRGGDTITPDEVIVTAGANHGVVLAVLAGTRPQHQVALPQPYFFNHVTQLQLLGRELCPMATLADDHYASSTTAWERTLTGTVRAALISQPRNPTSTQMPDDEMRELAGIAMSKDRLLIVDESYREFGNVVGKAPWSPRDGAIRVGSFSKSFCLAGWRIGYLVVPERWRQDVIRAQDALMIHPSIGSQHMAIAALRARSEDDYVGTLAAEMGSLRTFVGAELRKLNWIARVFCDAGTFVWVQLADGLQAEVVTEQLISECGVGVLSGRAFGGPAEQCLRIGIGCVPPDRLREALERLENWRARP